MCWRRTPSLRRRRRDRRGRRRCRRHDQQAARGAAGVGGRASRREAAEGKSRARRFMNWEPWTSRPRSPTSLRRATSGCASRARSCSKARSRRDGDALAAEISSDMLAFMRTQTLAPDSGRRRPCTPAPRHQRARARPVRRAVARIHHQIAGGAMTRVSCPSDSARPGRSAAAAPPRPLARRRAISPPRSIRSAAWPAPASSSWWRC